MLNGWLRGIAARIGFYLLISTAAGSILSGCTVVRPWAKPWTKGRLAYFNNDDYAKVLHRFVDKKGMVDYAALKVYRDDIENYYKQITYYSPDNYPKMFPTQADKLAYWINAYNATAMKVVLKYYPIRSIDEISSSIPSNFVAPRSGFFRGHRIILGGDTFSFASLEDYVAGERFADPRVHFALNSAVRGGPKLSREPYAGERLDDQLEKAAKEFFADDRNLRVDHERQTVYLSSLLNCYKGDFIGWMRRTDPEAEASLLAYAELYASPEKSADLSMAQEYDVRFVDFDWRLNDSNAGD